MPVVLTGTTDELLEVRALDDELDDLHEAIVTYLRKIGVDTLTHEQAAKFVSLMTISSAFEAIGDVIETDMVDIGFARLHDGLVVSEPTLEVITRFHGLALGAVEESVEAAAAGDEEVAGMVIDLVEEIRRLADEAHIHIAKRLVLDEPNRFAAYTREMDVIERIKRVFDFSRRVAKIARKGHGGRPSRLLGSRDSMPSMAPRG